jgi:hypothetical protein
LEKVLVEKFYFNSDYYKIDIASRIVYTHDFSVAIKLNLDVLKIDKELIYFILSMMQLNLLDLVSRADTQSVILELVSIHSKLKAEFRSKKKFAFFQRWLNGQELEKWILVLTDEEYSSDFETILTKLKIKRTGYGFKNKDKFSS